MTLSTFQPSSRLCRSLLLVCLSAGLLPSSVLAASQQELKGVKSEISRQQQSLSQQQKTLDQLQQALKQQEVGISGLENQIKQTKNQLAEANANIGRLKQKIAALESQRKQQADKLAELLQTYYITQRAKASGDLLNNGVEEDRISQYYQHLAKARTDTIAELEATRQALNDNERQLQLERDQITSLLEEQTRKRDQLAKTQSDRRQTLGKIQKSISGDKVYLAELQRNETRLKAEIAKAAKRNAVPMDGISQQRGKLPWPLKGQVLHQFGERQTGQIDWKGLVIDANYGQPVKAVYSGTVVFAEYLRGYGLVVLLDHGKGDMTLYGFNQTLMKKEGDKVTAGETLALAGDTGGQSRPALYFEIRRNSKAENPRNWLTR
ncbi:murein hydrolase activator EnvC [Vibrio fluvialis]|uniref:murein hydrolase activator EnvC family protein n=1 Tax=Vibrio TaxID=662 RepID=UPI0004627C5D|nr:MULTISPECIES: murein hydrolase activator EnvC [Vibrio]TNF13571.1 MAG: peptidase M23 [Vibrionaceae bacterium]AVH33148.1 peptidase M23 [Vibrio fluvialis]EKO3370226.1 murein hydrolase activator EnvC [Vibrio fluvialis]EKO3374763.1 murein hydrolase activator EnvC [Vibrio fluvialis]EKO3383264.1 murein hydrolase activator EnvC [Vibrio fluvialis]